MKRRIFAAAVLLAFSATPAAASGYYQFRCSNSTMLRVIFDDEAGTATVVPFGRPSIRLTRADGAGDGFRYVRRATHELRGSLEQVVWRVGRAQWTCSRAGS